MNVKVPSEKYTFLGQEVDLAQWNILLFAVAKK